MNAQNPNQHHDQHGAALLPVAHLVVDRHGHVLLKVLQPLRDVLLDPDGQPELVDLLLAGEMLEHGGPTPVLQVHKVALQHAQRHLRLGRRAAHDWIQRLRNLCKLDNQ